MKEMDHSEMKQERGEPKMDHEKMKGHSGM